MEERKKIMEIRRLLDFLKTAEQLKCNTRHSYTSSGRLESVAEHSWRLALMAMLVGDEFPEMDMDKVIKMCLIHGEKFKIKWYLVIRRINIIQITIGFLRTKNLKNNY